MAPFVGGAFDAQQIRLPCPQSSLVLQGVTVVPESLQEDCLYLNIWVPPNTNASSALPVVVYIPGGSFKAINPPQEIELMGGQLAQNTDSIVISIVYRYPYVPTGLDGICRVGSGGCLRGASLACVRGDCIGPLCLGSHSLSLHPLLLSAAPSVLASPSCPYLTA